MKTEPTITDDAHNFPMDKERVVILKFDEDSVTCSPTDKATDRPRPNPEETLDTKAVFDLQEVVEHLLCPKAEEAVKSLNPKLMPNTDTVKEPVAAVFLNLIDDILR